MNTEKLESIKERTFSIIESDLPLNEILLNLCILLDKEVPLFDWTGFYLTDPNDNKMLILGPYVGDETDHTRIPFGKGICGQAAETLETFVVQDVKSADNYLACSIHVQSEIVVPILKDGALFGELDIDSHTKNAISPELTHLCESICRKLETIL